MTDVLSHLVSSLDNLNLLTLDDLVADAPAEDAGVQAVTKHHRVDVALPPLVYQQMVVVGVFLLTPAVERFVDNQQS